MDWLLLAVGLLIVIFSSYTLGHWFGYEHGEDDAIERIQTGRHK